MKKFIIPIALLGFTVFCFSMIHNENMELKKQTELQKSTQEEHVMNTVDSPEVSS